jgi:hypothetical protein
MQSDSILAYISAEELAFLLRVQLQAIWIWQFAPL